MANKTLLMEIGVEELPPDMVVPLSEALAAALARALDDLRIAPGEPRVFGAPRRLAVSIAGLPEQQPMRTVRRKGPSLEAAFDECGKPTKAASGFARSCGIEVDALERKDGHLWMRREQQGRTLEECLREVLPDVVRKLPLAKRMRWDASGSEFIRPVRWVCAMHGERALDIQVCGCRSRPRSFGHRHHCPHEIMLAHADEYEDALHEAFVIADAGKRIRRVREAIDEQARRIGGQAMSDAAYMERACALTEWPCVLSAEFDRRFSSLPRDIVVRTLEGECNIVPLADGSGQVLPTFIVIADVESKYPREIRQGYARVIGARLEDASFFYRRDLRRSLESRRADLKRIVYVDGLGTLYDKTMRLKKLSAYTAKVCGADKRTVARAAHLSKCELATELVAERPELEGAIGAIYAENDGEPPEVAAAIREYRMPSRADDALPTTRAAQALALADRLDSLVGILGVGRAPTGDRDPYGVRRVAIAIVRMVIECEITMSLDDALHKAAAGFPRGAEADEGDGADGAAWEGSVRSAKEYIMERLRAHYQKRGENPNIVAAVTSAQQNDLLDVERRIMAVRRFMTMPRAEDLATANKRIHRILKKNRECGDVKPGVGTTREEAALHQCLKDGRQAVARSVKAGEYLEAMNALSAFAAPLETFFQNVMVMSDVEAERNNRLALLAAVRQLFLSIADFSALAGER